MREHTIETTITIGSSEVPATVEFFVEPSDDSVGYTGGVVIEAVTLHNMPDTKPHLRREPVKLTSGLLFDAVSKDEWLHEKCREHVSEDA